MNSANARPVIAVFASGGGSTFRATAEAMAAKLVDFTIGLVITDHDDAGVLQQVAEVNKLYHFTIATEVINKKRYPGGAQARGQTAEEATATCQALRQHHIDHLCLMGCLRIIGQEVITTYGWRPEYATEDPANQGKYRTRMTNTHPGILPATTDTFGIHTQEKVLELGLRETAHTFHAVATGVDTGPIIAEHRVAAFPSQLYKTAADTPEQLFARVQRIEKAYLPLDIDAFLKDQRRLQPTRGRSGTS
jgi:phosphoribosylglycinamide formyltransferase-1